MRTKCLGNSKLKISEIGLGCMGMSEFYGDSDERESIATLHHALDVGINFFDTADMYGSGANELLLAKAFKNQWNKIVIATKFGLVRDPNNREFIGMNAHPNYVKTACDASLKRLNINVIDLYYLHRLDPNVPIEDTVGAMADLVKAGKVRYLGLSEVNVETLKKAHQVHTISALQSEYSLWTRGPEKELIPLCEQLQISFIAYSPLGRGFLTSTINSVNDLATNDFRRTNPRFVGENFASNHRLVEQLRMMADVKNVTPAQLALAWLMTKSPNVIPIPGTRKRKYLEENINASEIQLSSNEVEQLEDLFALDAVSGDRYPEAGMKKINE